MILITLTYIIQIMAIESGINSTMKKHLSNITKKILKIKKLKKDSIVIDIASNDGTLLNSYKKR